MARQSIASVIAQ